MNGKYLVYINDCNLELDKIKRWIDANHFDTNVMFLSSYAILRACGTIEIVFKNIIFDCLLVSQNQHLEKYLSHMILDSSMNPSPGQIIKLLSMINPNWKTNFESRLFSTQQKGDLNSLVQLRNSLAHGNVITASIDETMLYFTSGIWVLEQLEQVVFII